MGKVKAPSAAEKSKVRKQFDGEVAELHRFMAQHGYLQPRLVCSTLCLFYLLGFFLVFLVVLLLLFFVYFLMEYRMLNALFCALCQ